MKRARRFTKVQALTKRFGRSFMRPLLFGVIRAGLVLLACVAMCRANRAWAAGGSCYRSATRSSGHFSVDIDGLYWKPFDNPDLGVLGPAPSTEDFGKVQAQQIFLSEAYSWGIRVGSRLTCYEGRLFALISGLYFRDRDTFFIEVTDPDLFFVSRLLSFSGTDLTLEVASTFSYYASDFLVGGQLLCGPCCRLSVFGGVRWFRNQRRLNSFGKQLKEPFMTSRLQASQHFAGTGPAAGFELSCQIGKGFSLYLVGIGAAAFGRSRLGTDFEIDRRAPEPPPQTFDTVLSVLPLLSPVVEGRFGLLYCRLLCGHTVRLRIAYEHRTHFESFRSGFVRPTPSGANSSLGFATNIGGFVLGGTLVF